MFIIFFCIVYIRSFVFIWGMNIFLDIGVRLVWRVWSMISYLEKNKFVEGVLDLYIFYDIFK